MYTWRDDEPDVHRPQKTIQVFYTELSIENDRLAGAAMHRRDRAGRMQRNGNRRFGELPENRRETRACDRFVRVQFYQKS